MIKAIIIEDEQKAMDLIIQILAGLPLEVDVIARLGSVKESIHFFMNEPEGDIIFSDIQLSDGLSFEIFQQSAINIPVIFTTCYDQFLLAAFDNNGIDYLLKPLDADSVLKALLKFKKLKMHFFNLEAKQLMASLSSLENEKKKSRIIVKQDSKNVLLRVKDIVMFYSENKLVYVVDYLNRKYLSDKCLSELEEELDAELFFRANRKFIININYIKGYKSFEKVKLLVDLNIPDIQSSIIISQLTAPSFRNWMRKA
jgi:DNA-binding LytR/AlgR family response regulator